MVRPSLFLSLSWYAVSRSNWTRLPLASRLLSSIHTERSQVKTFHTGLLIFLAFLEGNHAIERHIEILANHAGGILVGLDFAVEFGGLAVEEHVVFPMNVQACRAIDGLAAVEGFVAGQAHGTGAGDIRNVFFLIDR